MPSRLISQLVALILIATGTAGAADRQLPGRVLWVIDGDSLMLDVRGSHYRIELADIDAPELNQPWGRVAADRLKHALTGSFVVVHWSGRSDEGPINGSLIFKRRDIGLELLGEGLAWCTLAAPSDATRYQNHAYRDAEAAARKARRGLWSDAHPVPPWEWRRRGPVPSN